MTRSNLIIRLALVFTVSLAVACGDDSDDSANNTASNNTAANNTAANNTAANNTAANNTASGDADCTVSATITPDSTARTVTGLGSATCDGSADLEVETCVQWDPNGTFEDIQCFTNSATGTTELEVENLASCGISPGRTFRTRVNVTVDGEAQPEELSQEVSCD